MELFLAAAGFTVTVARIGTSSLTFEVAITQRGQAAGVVTFVLSQVDERRDRAVPLSDPQRAVLHRMAPG